MRPSLEEERRALLEQIEASRAVYRRMLADSPPASRLEETQRKNKLEDSFPRSRTMRWIMDHPLLMAAGVASLVWLTKGRASVVRSRVEKIRRAAPGLPLLKSLTVIGMMLLRDPARWQGAVRLAATALHWLQKDRHSPVK